ncbi:DUF4145 domain-containing protein [Treponema sp.]|uniref:DUF4145 domain-containing protein n=1 Tax=Treponema sp. TaxID=166 RepID=UPI00298E7EA1|nr:DUF4145 domain-containing protein [Treponema sp.]MCR5613242.1 DUF4145 domain-containing protein [Treponema sp.]
MSTWRDIWRYGVIANRFYAENEEKGLKAFRKLHEVYGTDGMIHYIYAEALERRNLREPALEEYKKAKELFPVPHWKSVAEDSIRRLKSNKTTEQYFNRNNFEQLLWYSFHKVYDYVYLNDFARYVSLSALARGSSEWPLSLVDFRTVLELEIKQCFPEVIKEFDDANRYTLNKTIEKLEKLGKIDSQKIKAFDNIRIAGNIAAHNLYADESYKLKNVNSFIKVLEFFNDYREDNLNSSEEEFTYPLCQLTLDQFLLIPDEEDIKEKLKESASSN